jgi:hypothetical protein
MFIQLFQFLYTSTDTLFWICAVIGTTLFILRMLMAFAGGAFSVDDFDMPEDIHADGMSTETDAHNSILSFKILTLHSLSGFLMLFGWAGLACRTEFELSYSLSLLIAMVSGICMMVLTALIMKGAHRLEAPGTLFSIEKTVGLIGITYQQIPAYGQGKVLVTVDSITRELLAQSHNQKDILSFTRIKIVGIIDHETVEVIEI